MTVDLATARYGGEVVWCSDEFFAAASNLVKPGAPVWREGEFTDHGKWMDGWETRRRRDEASCDSCVVRLGLPGVVESVTVDTSHFTGNFPESFSLEACGAPTERLEEAEWVEMISRTSLTGDTVAEFEVADRRRVTHVRLNIFPDGGVARLRVRGVPVPARDLVCPEQGEIDLALAQLGGSALEASDAHFSSPANLVSPGDPEGMWDGWETARRRGSGHDWVVVRLGLPGTIHRFDVDTRHFKGNSPGWVTLDAALGEGEWVEVCPRADIAADTINPVLLEAPVAADRVRLNIHPDGGVARLRVWGRPDPAAAARARVDYLDRLFEQDARHFFATACQSRRWIGELMGRRPFGSAAEVLRAVGAAFDLLGPDDWDEAFAAHPRIGERSGSQAAGGERMSTTEQSGVEQGDTGLRAELIEANRAYEERFGFTYIVRAAGRTGEEMLALARQRLGNDPATERQVAAAQQREITRLRLRRMLCLPEEEE